jgi:hypothetical protein
MSDLKRRLQHARVLVDASNREHAIYVAVVRELSATLLVGVYGDVSAKGGTATWRFC